MSGAATRAGVGADPGERTRLGAPSGRTVADRAEASIPQIVFATADFRIVQLTGENKEGVLETYHRIELADGTDLMGVPRWRALDGDKVGVSTLLKLVWALKDEVIRRIQ